MDRPEDKDNERTITEAELEEKYKEELDELKEHWIMTYYGGDVLEEIDPIAYNVGFQDFRHRLEEEGYKIEE